jgi:hypothetical protein
MLFALAADEDSTRQKMIWRRGTKTENSHWYGTSDFTWLTQHDASRMWQQ